MLDTLAHSLELHMHHTRTELEAALQAAGIEHTVYEHPAVYTVEEAQQHCGHIPGWHCKNLFLRTRKKQNWLLVLRDSTQVDLKTLAPLLDAKGLSFASSERLMQHLGVEPGSVTPLALINDSAHVVNLAMEAALMNAPSLNFHPLINTATINLEPTALAAFLASTGHAMRPIDCP